MSFFIKGGKNMGLEFEKSRSELILIVERLQKTLDEYYSKYLFEPSAEVSQNVYSCLSSACASNGRLLCYYFASDRLFNIPKGNEKDKDFMPYIREAVKIILENYNEELASDTEKIIRIMRSYGKEFMDSESIREMKELEQSLKLSKYIKSHRNFLDVERLLNIEKMIFEVRETRPSYVHEIIGAVYILEQFEEELKKVPDIKDKYFRAAILEDIIKTLPLQELIN